MVKLNKILLVTFCMLLVTFSVHASIDIESGEHYNYSYVSGNTTYYEDFYCKINDIQCGSLNCNVNLTCPEQKECPECPDMVCENKTDYLNMGIGIILILLIIGLILVIIFKDRFSNPKQNPIKKEQNIKKTIEVPNDMTLQEAMDKLGKG